MTERRASSQAPLADPPADPRASVEVVHRPWGEFQQLVHNTPVTVKILTVAPGRRLSLQRHARRGELWQVVDGPVEVTVEDRTWMAQPDEQVWIPVGAIHRLGNPGTRPGRVLELAFGDFDEDDIERLQDDFAR
ncbi:MAG: phosphomannose isomerase type II C-terminal cupin domain [Angustibacter sp.]